MRVITVTADSTGYSHDIAEGYPPDEIEWRVVQLAEERFPECKQIFFYDDDNNPAVDLLDIGVGKVIHTIRCEAE